MVAVIGTQVIFVVALRAMSRQFTTRHGNERTVSTIDDLQVADNEGSVDRDRAKRSQPIFRPFHQFDANFGNFHQPALP
jgi:hypothetical protein